MTVHWHCCFCYGASSLATQALPIAPLSASASGRSFQQLLLYSWRLCRCIWLCMSLSQAAQCMIKPAAGMQEKHLQQQQPAQTETSTRAHANHQAVSWPTVSWTARELCCHTVWCSPFLVRRCHTLQQGQVQRAYEAEQLPSQVQLPATGCDPPACADSICACLQLPAP